MDDLEYVRVFAPYVAIRKVIVERRVLDVGCSLGYGSWLMAGHGAATVTGLDMDKERLKVAEPLCRGLPNCRILCLDAQHLIFENGAFDLATCFEVIEHVPAPQELLGEIRRVLKPEGILLMSTPNRNLRLFSFQKPTNAEHLREYAEKDFRGELSHHFSSIRMLGIYGREDLQEYYRALWRPRLFRTVVINPLRRLAKKMAPDALVTYVRSRREAAAAPRSIPAATAQPRWKLPKSLEETWPFFVSEARPDCLNYFAVCGNDEKAVDGAARLILEGSGSGR
jgi:SAM-dependent methyltransferase